MLRADCASWSRYRVCAAVVNKTDAVTYVFTEAPRYDGKAGWRAGTGSPLEPR